ncbi:MAG: DUF2007 domain-containing protein [Chloroherpetonaceae bacterium]|nr:DUF2007 domain-containing protein [Chloroherpetonaceae bacterium]MDW8437855.1 DUF2007 domain-containing protein [Chloroherpetonaceae bacterium]
MRRLFKSVFFSQNIEPTHWRVAFRTTVDFEAEILKATLSDAGIEAVIFTKRDRMFSFFASPQPIEVWVRAEDFEEATRLVADYHRQNAPINALTKEQCN